MSNSKADWKEEKPLAVVTCSSHACAKDLHNFLRPRPRDQSYRNESCVACGAKLIDWQRLDRHDLSDIAYTVEALEYECVRHYYWHEDFDEKAVDHALRTGLIGLRDAANQRLRKYVGPPRKLIFRDGTQTPKIGNIIYYAQHATATCCRRCIEAWHGIDRTRALAERELNYMTELIMFYINKRWSEVSAKGAQRPEHGASNIGKGKNEPTN